MSASAEPTRLPAAGAAWQLWRPAGVVFLAVSLAALAAGMFPEGILPSHLAGAIVAPPALGTLLGVQAAFLVLFAPWIWGGRLNMGTEGGGSRLQTRFIAFGDLSPDPPRQSPSPEPGHSQVRTFGGPRQSLAPMLEYVFWIVASVPLYVVAAWVSDGSAVDVVRGVLYLAAVAAGAWGLGLWAASDRPAMMTAAGLLGAISGIGLPVACYLLAELTNSPQWSDRLWSAAPATCAFSAGSPGQGRWYPTPAWAWALWAAAGVLFAFARLLIVGRPKPQ